MAFLSMARVASSLIFKAKKYAPEIWMGVGIVSGIAATGFAVKSTLRVDEVIVDHEQRMAVVREKKQEMLDAAVKQAKEETGKDLPVEEVSLQREQVVEIGKSTLHEYLKTFARGAKLYAPTICLTAVSVASILIAHGLLKRRYLGVVAAYGALQSKYDILAGGVAKEYGEDTLRRLERGETVSKAEQAAVAGNENPDEVDQETIEELSKLKINESGWTSLDRIFNEDTSKRYDKYNCERNRMFLKSVQNAANAKLASDGWLTLNWVYHQLGMPRTKAGHVMGWLYDPEGKGANGPTGFVSFGLITDEEFRKWVSLGCDGTERSVPLHFGGCGFGLIYDRLPLEDI